MKDFCQIEANKDTSYYSMRSIFSYAPMSFLRTEKRLLNCSMGTRSQSASSAGKFETQAQILAKRHHRWLLAS